MALLQIYTTLLGQGLPNLATLMFNRQVCGIMPVLDQKPIGKDYDDEHHSKLLDWQHKNNNDALLWTHGTVVNIGDHNHHD